MTVAGPEGIYISRELTPGETPSLSLFQANGEPLPDGTYTYELRAAPPLVQGGRADKSKRDILQWGSFTVREGSFVATGQVAGSVAGPPKGASQAQLRNVAAAAAVVSDDQVVQGNACIGNECGAGDANVNILKLKDTFAVQILFEDVFDNFTHSRDWALQANDAVGGLDRFFLRDVDAGTSPFSVQGNAPDNALVVSSSGNLGLGTATPGAKLHLFGNATADAVGSAGPDPASGPAFNFGYGGASFGRGAGAAERGGSTDQESTCSRERATRRPPTST